MLNNRVRFGNMKRVNRAVWALTVILMMVLGLVLAGCSGSSDGADGKEESTYSKIVAIAKKGRSLADVKDELKDAGFSSSDYEVKSDTDKWCSELRTGLSNPWKMGTSLLSMFVKPAI